ncbi:alkylphosphonate utilization protein [Solirhodobacter olei]|uniref:alkylphosphonate utilization protein n=1 Tax=Solirhodobacter olei TaxID=2493082 RepID=UPI000FD7C7FA|nr:alkylphosphonate utilization protein [Solirhodobacter olei]
MVYLPPLRLTGATILRDGEMQRRSLGLADGRIAPGPFPEVDLGGFLLMPGIVDLCFDAPAGGSAALSRALQAAGRTAAAAGITTGFLAQGWSWEGGPRAPARAAAVGAELARTRQSLAADLRLRLDCETHLTDSGAALLSMIEAAGGGYVVFRDTAERAEEAWHADPAGFALRAWAAGRTPEEHLAAAAAARGRAREVPRHLCRLAEAFDRLGLVYGSHGDADGETREGFAMIGARVADCPATRKAAAAAHAMMNPVLLPADGIAGPGECPRRDLIRQGLCDALVSAGRPGALAEAAFALVEQGILTLPRAWALISARPAEILRMPDRGALTPGLRSDVVAVNAESRAVEAVIAGGRLTHLAGEAARRFQNQPRALAVAAE